MLRAALLMLAVALSRSLVMRGTAGGRQRCDDARMQVAPGTKLLVIGGNGGHST